MTAANKQEAISTINAFLTIEEILAFDGRLDCSKTDKERKRKLENAQKTIIEIAAKRKMTVRQLWDRTVALAKKTLA